MKFFVQRIIINVISGVLTSLIVTRIVSFKRRQHGKRLKKAK